MKPKPTMPEAATTAVRFVEETAVSTPRKYIVLNLSGAPADEIQAELNKLARDGWRLLWVIGPLHYLESTAVPDKQPALQQVPFKAAFDATGGEANG